MSVKEVWRTPLGQLEVAEIHGCKSPRGRRLLGSRKVKCCPPELLSNTYLRRNYISTRYIVRSLAGMSHHRAKKRAMEPSLAMILVFSFHEEETGKNAAGEDR